MAVTVLGGDHAVVLGEEVPAGLVLPERSRDRGGDACDGDRALHRAEQCLFVGGGVVGEGGGEGLVGEPDETVCIGCQGRCVWTRPSQPNAETVAIAVPWFSRGMPPAALFTVGTTLPTPTPRARRPMSAALWWFSSSAVPKPRVATTARFESRRWGLNRRSSVLPAKRTVNIAAANSA
jgi:hypothetical protein